MHGGTHARTHTHNEKRRQVINIPASYSVGSGFKFPPEDRLPWLMMFLAYLLSKQILGRYLKLLFGRLHYI